MSLFSNLVVLALLQGVNLPAQLTTDRPPSAHWGSLKYNLVNGRAGPGSEYPVVWQYHRRNLPVLIIRKSSQWSKIEDMTGDILWMDNSQLSQNPSRNALIVSKEPAALLANGRKRNRTIARLQPGLIVRILVCQSEQCQVRAKDKTGWVSKKTLWGPVQTDDTQE